MKPVWHFLLILLFFNFAFPDEEIDGDSGEEGGDVYIEEGNPDRPLIYIDPGHGGTEEGAVGENQNEKFYNLDVALRIRRLLLAKGFRVLMTREKDIFVSDAKKIKAVNDAKPALVLSIHHNSHSSGTVSGVEVFLAKNSKTEVAKVLLQEVVKNTKAKNRGHQYVNYSFLEGVQAKDVLAIECGFLSNRLEARKIDTEAYRISMAQGICDGILKYLFPDGLNQ